MNTPLSPDTILAQVDVNRLHADPQIKVRSTGQNFNTLAEAEAAGRSLSRGPDGDAAIVRHTDGSYGLYQVDEFSSVAGVSSSDLRKGRLVRALKLPAGAVLQSFMVSANDNNPDKGERVVTGTAQDGVRGGALTQQLLKDLERLHLQLGGQSIDRMRDDITLPELQSTIAELTNIHTSPGVGHEGLYRRKSAGQLLPLFEAAATRLKARGTHHTTLGEIAAGQRTSQSDNRVEDFLQAARLVQVPAPLLHRLRGEATLEALHTLQTHLEDTRISLMDSPLGAASSTAQVVRGLSQQTQYALSKLAKSGAESLPFDELAGPLPAALPSSHDPLAAEGAYLSHEQTVDAWGRFPKYQARIKQTLNTSIESLRSKVELARSRGKDASSLQLMLEGLEHVNNLIFLNNPSAALAALENLGEKARSSRALQPTNVWAMQSLKSVVNNLRRSVRGAPAVRAVTPPKLQQLARQFFDAGLEASEPVINAAFADPETLVDWLGSTGRKHPHDVARAVYLYHAAAWSVLRDIEYGSITPGDFSRQSLQQVTAKDIRALVIRRLKNDSTELENAVQGMDLDPSWQASQLSMPLDSGSVPLRPENIDWTLDSAVSRDSKLAWRFATHESPVMQHVLASAATTAELPEDELGTAHLRTKIDVAHTLYTGSADISDKRPSPPMLSPRDDTSTLMPPPNASEVQAMLVEVASLDIVDPKLSTVFETAQQASVNFASRKSAGQPYDGLRELPDGRVLAYTIKSTEGMASEVAAQMQSGEFDHLGEKSLGQISELIGPPGNWGDALAARMESEHDSKYWRDFASEAIEIAVVGAASGGIGALAGSSLVAVNATANTIKAGRFIAQSASFTTLMGAASGNLSPKSYAYDAAMFGVLRWAGRFAGALSQFGGKTAAAQVGRFVARNGVAIGSTTAVMQGFQAMEALAKTGALPDWQQTKESLTHTLMMVTVLHGVNSGVARLVPMMAEGAPEAAKFKRLAGRVQDANQTANAKFEALNKAIEAKDGAAAKRIIKELDAQGEHIDVLRTELLQFTQRSAPSLTGAVIEGFGKASNQVSRAALTDAQVALQQAIATNFSDLSRLGMGTDTVAPGVKSVGSRAMMALMDVTRSPFASVGVDNINHLGSVFERAVSRQATDLRRPLTQQEVNRVFAETLLTDIWMKGIAADAMKHAPTAPTNAGDTVGQFHTRLKSEAKRLLFKEPMEFTPAVQEWTADKGRAPVTAEQLRGAIKSMVEGWIDRGAVPMSPDAATLPGGVVVPGVKQHAAKAAAQLAKTLKLSAKQGQALEVAMVEQSVAFWGARIMAEGHWATINGFMLGTWVHGLPPYALIESTVESIPTGERAGLTPQAAAEAVYGHHMAGYVAAGLARGGIKVQFQAMEVAGQLSKGGAQRLDRLYDASMQLARKWWPSVHRGLTPTERAEYWNDATPLRKAMDSLPKPVRDQLLADDSGQFRPTARALGKWEAMQGAAQTNGAALGGVIKTVNAYLEEARGRDAQTDPAKRGSSFIKDSDIAMHRIGAAIDPHTGLYAPTPEGHATFSQHALRLRETPAIMDKAVAALGKSAPAMTDLELVTWFRDGPKMPNALTDLSQNSKSVIPANAGI